MAYLNEKQRRFCSEYVLDLNATQAALRAGYSAGKDNGVAAVTGSRLLQHAKVQVEIQRVHRRHLDNLDLRVEDVLSELKTIAFSDLRRLFTRGASGQQRLVDLVDLPDDVAARVASVDVAVVDGAATVSRIRTWDKTRALDLLLKRLLPEQHLHLHAFSPTQLAGMSNDQLDRVERANLLLAEVSTEVGPGEGDVDQGG